MAEPMSDPSFTPYTFERTIPLADVLRATPVEQSPEAYQALEALLTAEVQSQADQAVHATRARLRQEA